jgi:hypothetical protein
MADTDWIGVLDDFCCLGAGSSNAAPVCWSPILWVRL